ncbi:MAG: tetratricopeptide repeat protein [Planctomycetota bacterium]
MRTPSRSLAALLAGLLATAAAAGEPPSLAERLRAEQKKLADLQARLDAVRDGAGGRGSRFEPGSETSPAPSPADGSPTSRDAANTQKGTDQETATPDHVASRTSTPGPRSPLLRRPKLPAADVLYRLGRYAQARAVYEAVLQRQGLSQDDRVWAGLQAGNCCRRLGDFDLAIEQFQTVMAACPDHPWCTGHVAWALRTAQWEKRWAHLERKAAPPAAATGQERE